MKFGLFPLFYIMNNASVNICVQVFVWMYAFLLLDTYLEPYIRFLYQSAYTLRQNKSSCKTGNR